MKGASTERMCWTAKLGQIAEALFIIERRRPMVAKNKKKFIAIFKLW